MKHVIQCALEGDDDGLRGLLTKKNVDIGYQFSLEQHGIFIGDIYDGEVLTFGVREGEYITPLMAAAAANRLDTMSTLLRIGAAVDRSAPRRSLFGGNTALALAVRVSSTETDLGRADDAVEFLLEHGANPNLEVIHEGQACTPIDIAIPDASERCIEALIAAGVHLEPYHLEAARYREWLFRRIICAGVDPKECDAALLGSFVNTEREIYRMLRGAGLTVRDADKPDQSLIATLVGAWDEEFAKELLSEGADLHNTLNGLTPIGRAVYDRQAAVIDSLLTLGADPMRAFYAGESRSGPKQWHSTLWLARQCRLPEFETRFAHLEGRPGAIHRAYIEEQPVVAATSHLTSISNEEFASLLHASIEVPREAGEAVSHILKRESAPLDASGVGQSFPCERKRALAFMRRKGADLLSLGALAFATDGGLGVLGTTNPDVVLAVMRVSEDFDFGPHEVIAWFREMRSKYPLRLAEASRERLGFFIESDGIDYATLAKDIQAAFGWCYLEGTTWENAHNDIKEDRSFFIVFPER